jgi:hypothetical protein
MQVYETGALLWGAAKSVGNVWIVTDSIARTVSLLFDGKNKRFCPDFGLTRHDIIKPTSFLYELTTAEIAKLTSSHVIPQWAIDIMQLKPRPKPSTGPIASVTLSPSVVRKVEKALNVNLTSRSETVIIKRDEEKCPVSGSEHSFTPYTGLIQSFEFCVHCDKKRNKGTPT